jgi:tetratricopeptide (TPR) repeat protein
MGQLDEKYNEIVDKIATPKARLLLLEILKDEGKPEKLIKACHRALESFPDDINIRKLLAETYFEQGFIGLAELELEKISKQINQLSSIFKLRADIFRKEGRTKEAIDSLKTYLNYYGNDQEAARALSELSTDDKEETSVIPTPTLAEMYYDQGEIEEAIKIYEQVIQASPEDEKSKTRLDELKSIQQGEKEEIIEEEAEIKEEDSSKEKKVKLIGILERWLANIEQAKAINLSAQN